MQKSPNKSELLKLARAGDDRAHEELLKLVRGVMLPHATRILLDPDLAEDATQEALLEFARYVPQIRIAESCTVLARRMVLKASDRIMRKKRPLNLEDLDAWPGRVQAPEDLLLGQALDELLRGLNEVDRRLFALRFQEQRSVAECADAIGLDFVQTRYRIARLRQACAAGLRRQGFGPLALRMCA